MRISCFLLAVLLSVFSNAAFAQERVVTGQVISAEDPGGLPGVNVTVKGTTTGTVTDVEGKYRLSVPNDNNTLVFSFIGMIAKEVAVGSQSTVNVTLETDTKQLKEVVVTALGIEKDRNAVNYAVQEVSGESLIRSQQANLVNALQGQVAGVMINNSGGTPGGGSNILIRGATSIEGNNSPLFVIDGIPVDNSTVGEFDNSSSGMVARSVNNTNRMADINPNDIESISVLKGPAAAALYGSRGSNGAVLITTKKGVQGTKKSLTYSGSLFLDSYNKLPEYQTTYGQGTGGIYNPTTRISWGLPIREGEQNLQEYGKFFPNRRRHGSQP